MKYFTLIIFYAVSSSCCGAKTSIENTEEKVIIATEIPKPSEQQENTENSETKEKNLSEKTILNESTTDVIEPIIEHDTPLKTFNHDKFNALLKKYVSKNGNVNYKGFKNDRILLSNYIQSLSENTPKNDWSKEDKLAYWINAYNAMTIDFILRHYPLKSIKDINNPWDKRYWKLGDKWYNLNEIEHEILRKMNEPRIHFAIVCASVSCPKLQNEVFTASNLDEQLTNATKEFLADTSKNNISENNIKLSKIFQWFSKDFKKNGSLIDFLNQYSGIKISAKAKKTFKDYNWGLNE
jgi:hypothetical protein